jgi:phosphatidylglycerophosphate synthase
VTRVTRVSRVTKEVVYHGGMLVAVAVSALVGEASICAVVGALALSSQAFAGRAWRTPSGALALANVLTLVRLALVVALPVVVFPHLERTWVAAFVLGLLVLDGVDGRVARARGEGTPLGASLDMETDALTVMVLTLLLWTRCDVGPWVLVAGLWRYAFGLVAVFAPAIGDTPPSRLYRFLCGVLLVTLAAAFLPWEPLPVASAAAGTAVVSFSFLVSIARSRALLGRRQRTGSTLRNARV